MILQMHESRADPANDTAASGDRTVFNIASYLPRMAAERPNQSAVVLARSRHALTFAELESLSNRYANGLTTTGITRGTRVLVMVKPGFEFLGLIFALFKIGAVPVMIDPGMGVGRMLECIRTVDLHGFVGVPLAHVVRVLRSSAFKSVRSVVTVGKRWFWGGRALEELQRGASGHFTIAETKPTDTAAILFTSGSTGPAKGVVYEHGMFDAQVRTIQSFYKIEPGEIDLPTFPLFGLFSVAMGMTAVIPDMDAARPARVDPAKIVEAIRDHGVTNTFGSPAIWTRVAPYCVEHGIVLPTLRRVLIAGAPVPWPVIEQLHHVLSAEADVHTPYGATESMPVSSISGRDVLGASRGLQPARTEAQAMSCVSLTRRGAGTCVGRPVPGADVRLIRITDDPIREWSDELGVPDGEFGEIAVAGPAVTKAYFGLPNADALSKIHQGDKVWHRIGDIGYRDSEGRLWFCGRKSQRVVTQQGTLFTDCCEGVFNEHPDVARSALVGVGPAGRQTPVIVIEPKPGCFPHGARVGVFARELLDLIGKAVPSEPETPATGQPNCPSSTAIRQSTFDTCPEPRRNRQSAQVLFHRSLPVDVRHNAKINREALARWAARRLA
jgi:acyl-CoA synthetase (AMP-forming)/AMP-acid ligase II